MALTSGQILFAACFVVTFIVVMIFAYRTDWLKQRNYYRGSLRVLLVIVAIWLTLYYGVRLF